MSRSGPRVISTAMPWTHDQTGTPHPAAGSGRRQIEAGRDRPDGAVKARQERFAADPDYGYQRFSDIVDELSAKLNGHLAHEEADGLPLIDASLTPAQWQHFAQVHGERNLPDASRFMPWLLTGARPELLDEVLGKLPPPLLTAYREQWAPAYAAQTIWPAAEPEPQHTGPES